MITCCVVPGVVTSCIAFLDLCFVGENFLPQICCNSYHVLAAGTAQQVLARSRCIVSAGPHSAATAPSPLGSDQLTGPSLPWAATLMNFQKLSAPRFSAREHKRKLTDWGAFVNLIVKMRILTKRKKATDSAIFVWVSRGSCASLDSLELVHREMQKNCGGPQTTSTFVTMHEIWLDKQHTTCLKCFRLPVPFHRLLQMSRIRHRE